MTRTISSWPSALVRLVTSDSAAGAAIGATICHLSAAFLMRRDVAGCRLDLHFLDLVGFDAAEHRVALGGAVLAGLLRGDEVDVRAEPGEDQEQRNRRSQPLIYRLRHQLYTPEPKTSAGTSSSETHLSVDLLRRGHRESTVVRLPWA